MTANESTTVLNDDQIHTVTSALALAAEKYAANMDYLDDLVARGIENNPLTKPAVEQIRGQFDRQRKDAVELMRLFFEADSVTMTATVGKSVNVDQDGGK